MLKAIVCVKDRAADVFNQPWFVPHRNVAVRDFTDEVNRVAQDNPLNKHPDDYDLYFLGNYNDAAGSFDLEPSPVILVRGKDVAAS